ncbi:MAG: ABC transporter ATP-binding protein [Rhodospirillales bacterium]|nr:ABC transporter ATP-binding protein [Rhodospirillales bacterium]
MSDLFDKEALVLSGIKRSFTQGEKTLEVLRGIDLTIKAGEIVALVGPSGSGKSTLLQIAGLLEAPDGGVIKVGGTDCSSLNDRDRTQIRRDSLGFVYQYHHLLPEFSAVENIVIPQIIGGLDKETAATRANDLLEYMALTERADHRPGQLSGGEQQRVAIARALANAPAVLLADEPTGNLDPNTAERVFGLLLKLVKGSGLAALIATHNPELAKKMDRAVTLVDGTLQEV